MKMQFSSLAIVLLFLSLFAGCGETDCSSLIAVNVSPQSATADHNAAPPGNAMQFAAFGTAPSGCIVPAIGPKNPIPQSSLNDVVWSVSDPTNVSISNAQDATYGTATCLAATAGPVTVTANLPANRNHGKALAGTATLSCN
jgi:hypothetical protein